MKKENTYAMTALMVIKTHSLFPTLELAWKATIKELSNSKSTQIKGCPKNTFLGLCEEGLIKGILKGSYTRSIKNKNYAIAAIDILRTDTVQAYTSIQLWKKVCIKLHLRDKSHNSQMDVVLVLWENGLII